MNAIWPAMSRSTNLQQSANVPKQHGNGVVAGTEVKLAHQDETRGRMVTVHVVQQLFALQAIVSCLSFDGRLILDLPERGVGQSPLCAALTHAARFLTRNAQKWHIPDSVEEQILATAKALDQSIAHRIQMAEAAVHNGV